MYKFLCQGCLKVIESGNWEKYHLTDDSCPYCESDMCVCPSCIQYIDENNLEVYFKD